MTAEENPKAYDKALERAKEYHFDGAKQCIIDTLEYIFPELAESEDERIRKEIISIVKSYRESCITEGNHRFDNCISWLEKQGKKQPTIVWHSVSEEPEEMKELFCEWESGDATWHDVAFYDKESHTFRHAMIPINVTKWVYVDELLEEQVELKTPNPDEMKFKVGDAASVSGKPFDYEHASITQKDFAPKQEPKFKVGDWIVDNRSKDTFFLKSVNSGYCSLEDAKGNIYSPCLPFESDFHLWTIQDAKKGDVLEFEDYGRVVVGVVSFVSEKTGKVDVSCLLEDNNFKIGNFYALDTIKPHPATKEQRDLLFSKMKEAGYEWDAEKKKLKKIEQKPIDKIEPKFKVGDWVIDTVTDSVKQIIKVTSSEYICSGHLIISFDNQHLLKKWTIGDAKDGDVLVEYSCIFILKEYKTKDNALVYCCLFDDSELELSSFNLRFFETETHPATKEQRETLFKAMHEAGYEWDAEKKELKKIEHKPVEWHREDEQNLNACLGYIPDEFLRRWLMDAIHDKYDNPVWSEEDERMCQETIDWFEKKCFPYALESENPARESIKWLKSLKERYTWKPSNEQMDALEYYATSLSTYSDRQDDLFSLLKPLKKLREE